MVSNRLRVGLAATVLMCAGAAFASRVSDVRNTLHNLSSTGPGTVKATTETQVCVFCHTPHGATQQDAAGNSVLTPLWNRQIPSPATYTAYDSSSLDAKAIQGSLNQPGGSSKLCLSCHDGTLALGNVNVLNGQLNATITMTGTGPGGVMPPGSGTTTGFTRSIGADLTNDHPISLNYTSALATRDGELRPVDANQKWPPGSGTVVGVRSSGYRPLLPLEPTGSGGVGQIQCATCHDPHIRETDTAQGNQKFLRTNRFQEAAPTPTFTQANDIICLACHDKNGTNGIWAYSAHANPQVAAAQTYTAAAAAQREFPANLPVWKAACLNCHDTHTVQGARRLLREGTDSVATPKAGGAAALEETCYQCHRDAAGSAITPVTSVPNIRDDFLLARRMPIRSADQSAGSEMHDIGGNFNDASFVDCTGSANQCGKDFIEQRSKLGVGNPSNRHAECTDCHNPHRVVKFRDFRGNPAGVISGAPDAEGTHRHTDTTGYTHTNIISGVLRGAWGVEPFYGSNSFHALPTGYTVKRGDPGASVDTAVTAAYVTREYQICLKCHSDYGYSDNNVYPLGNRPNLGFPGGTPSGTNGLNMYTNQAKEFHAPTSHAVPEPVNLGNDAGSADSASRFNNNNHRSWHPVTNATGRSGTNRGNGPDISARWTLPWSNTGPPGAVGTQTMYCSDCHGSNVPALTSVIPNGGANGNPWGPHGSANNFLLKGLWNSSTGSGQEADGLCFKCHDYVHYATDTWEGNRSGHESGFGGSKDTNLHALHAKRLDNNRIRCVWCHVAVPHGWKNKALLVNLNDVGQEAGQGVGSSKEVAINATGQNYSQEPYYLNAKLKIVSFARSGTWTDANCGSVNKTGSGLNGLIANSQGGTTNLVDTGVNWMKDTCNNPP